MMIRMIPAAVRRVNASERARTPMTTAVRDGAEGGADTLDGRYEGNVGDSGAEQGDAEDIGPAEARHPSERGKTCA